MSQDLPPVGGYEPVQYRRNLPPRGFRPGYYLIAIGVITVYGFHLAIKGIKEQRELYREKMWARIHLIPVMQAETDRDLVRRVWAAQKREELVMKDVKGYKASSVYHSDRFVRPSFGVSPGENTSQESYYFKDWEKTINSSK